MQSAEMDTHLETQIMTHIQNNLWKMIYRGKTNPCLGHVSSQLIDHLLAGIEDVVGYWGQHYWKDKLVFLLLLYLLFPLKVFARPIK